MVVESLRPVRWRARVVDVEGRWFAIGGQKCALIRDLLACETAAVQVLRVFRPQTCALPV
jgi:hypothetical protein